MVLVIVAGQIDLSVGAMTEAFWQPIIKGLILVAAVAVDMAGRKTTR